MVAKISIGSSLYGAISYNGEKINEAKGRILAANKIILPPDGKVSVNGMVENFKVFMPKMGRTKKPVLHISLNPHPDDRLSDQDLEVMAREYLERLGFGNQPWVMYKHEDIDRHHIHIVTVNVNEEGKRLNQDFLYRRSKKITTELEDKYNLHKAQREKVSPDTPITKLDPSGDIKRQVANTVKLVGMRWKFQTLGEYNAILGLYNIRCEETDGRVNGREYHGLVYFALNDNGEPIANPFKASRLGKFASRTAVEGRFERSKEKINLHQLKRKVDEAKAESRDLAGFIANLKERGIDLVLRYTDTGRIYGATFVDLESTTAANGSRLGKEYSANAIEQWKNNIVTEQAVESPTSNQERNTHSETQTQPDTGNHHFPNSNKTVERHSHDDYSDSIPDLGGLFSTGPAFNAEEEAFYRAMQRRKKKKRRGPKL
ncbi:conjugal transfer protein MobB [Bacteroides acidifaciens]|uniref:conjugal transfer protein MobB n=1 Tax=Bacteroides acidifaciens TaxID=85831 RepID=UPI00263A3541|nr:conjugal transfer protein MobB [Bacteroides acidifaciens]